MDLEAIWRVLSALDYWLTYMATLVILNFIFLTSSHINGAF